MESLDRLNTNVGRLIERYNALLYELQANREYTARLQQELSETQAKVVAVQEANKYIKSVAGMLGDASQRVEARKTLTALIAQCDKILEVLKK